MMIRASTCLLGAASFGIAFATKSKVPSPSAHTDLICPNNNPTDCYSQIFQPTEDFQIVREGQDLPPGLHVRMNVWTGEKEARLNIPIDGQTDLDGLPTEQSVVVVDQPQDGNVEEDEPVLRNEVSRKAPGYDVAGKIMPPREPGGSGGDSENFWGAVRIISDSSASTDDVESALTVLSNLAHDIYYGVELAKQAEVLWTLISLMSSESPLRRRQAASILGGSLQNNPTALKEFRKSWESRIYANAGQAYKDRKACEEENLLGQLRTSLRQETDPAATRAKLSVLAGLSKDPRMRDCFVVKLGMGDLLRIFLKEGNEWVTTRVKITQYITDTFLDEDMGAELGIWPRQKPEFDEYCQDSKLGTHPGCWEYHLEKMVHEQGKRGEAEIWLVEFLRLLRSSTSDLPWPRREPLHEEL